LKQCTSYLFYIFRVSLDRCAAPGQTPDDILRFGLFIVKGNKHCIVSGNLVFYDTRRSFQDSTYPGPPASGSALGHGQPDLTLGRPCQPPKTCRQEESRRDRQEKPTCSLHSILTSGRKPADFNCHNFKGNIRLNPEKCGPFPNWTGGCRKMRILWIILTRCNMHFFNALDLTRREGI
jgi:hypothetical protein